MIDMVLSIFTEESVAKRQRTELKGSKKDSSDGEIYLSLKLLTTPDEEEDVQDLIEIIPGMKLEKGDYVRVEVQNDSELVS